MKYITLRLVMREIKYKKLYEEGSLISDVLKHIVKNLTNGEITIQDYTSKTIKNDFEKSVVELINDNVLVVMPDNSTELGFGEFLKDNLKSYSEYVNENDDFIYGYNVVLKANIDIDKLRSNIGFEIDLCDDDIMDIVLENYTLERSSTHLPDNVLSFVNIDELSCDLHNISNEESECILTSYTRDLKANQISAIANKYINDATYKDGYLYFCPDFSSIQLIVCYEKIEKSIKDKMKKAS